MADVTIICIKCGEPIRVSEYVDVSGMTCSKCGEHLPPPVRTKRGPSPTVVRKLREVSDPVAPPDPKRTTKHERTDKPPKHKPRHKQETWLDRLAMWRPSNYAGSWFIFISLGTVMALLRFGDILTPSALDEAILYGQILLSIMYSVIVIDAFREESFEGMLCFFVPGYALFYLFAKSDSFYLRAFVGALGIAFGFDLFMFLVIEIGDVVEMGNNWITSGGGKIK